MALTPSTSTSNDNGTSAANATAGAKDAVNTASSSVPLNQALFAHHSSAPDISNNILLEPSPDNSAKNSKSRLSALDINSKTYPNIFPSPSRQRHRRHTVGDPTDIPVTLDSQLVNGSAENNSNAPPNSPLTPTTSPIRRLTRSKSDKDGVLVGTPVKEGHANYALMYDMLTGIRISVSRCNAKPMRSLDATDFSAAHKLAFDVAGNELTPSSKYDFKFKDYAPWVFRKVRDAFRVDPAEYLLSLTGRYVLSEISSPGKSGSFFYYSQDYRFIIKTVHHSEHRFMRRILKSYYEHVVAYPNTLLSRIFGLHRVKLPGNRKIHFVVMGNVFPANKDIHEVYDLKGSTVGRSIPEEEARSNPRAVMKDLNWMSRHRKMILGPTKKNILTEQMRADVDFLVKHSIMDYSLLIGVHDVQLGNKKNIRDNTLAVFEATSAAMMGSLGRGSLARRGSRARKLRMALREADPVALGPSSAKLPDESPAERRHVVFYQDQGGFQATTDNDEPADEIYYIGIIDIFTRYDAAKKAETFFKSLTHEKNQISSVKPPLYGSRFLEFMERAMDATGVAPASVTSSITSSAKGDKEEAGSGSAIREEPEPVVVV